MEKLCLFGRAVFACEVVPPGVEVVLPGRAVVPRQRYYHGYYRSYYRKTFCKER